MKYWLLFSLLFILVSSKIEKKKTLLSLAKTFLLEENEDDGYGQACFDEELDTAEKCKAVTENLFLGTQCCFVKAKVPGEEDQETCTVNAKPFKPYVDIIQNNKFIPFVREVVGFAAYGPPGDYDAKEIIGQKVTIDVDCSDSHLQSKEFKIDEFTSEEKDILNSTDHCLYEIYDVFEKMDDSKDDDEPYAKAPSTQALKCKDRKLLKTSKDHGLECGTLKININAPMGMVPPEFNSFSSCILFDYDLYSKIKVPKDLISDLKKQFNLEDKYYLKIEISDSKGRKFVFDTNRSSFISISKYLLILIGLILL